MFDIHDAPLTQKQARTARAYLGLTQAKTAEESGLRIDKLKRFEAGFGKSGAYVPDLQFLRDLRAFYEARGYAFEDTPAPGANAKQSGLVFPGGVVASAAEEEASGTRPVKTALHHMRIALSDEDEMGHVLDLIDENEADAMALLRAPVETSFFGGLTEASEARHARAMKLLAENGVLFARLFGRDIGGTATKDVLTGTKRPENHAELLQRANADVHLAAAGDRDARERHKASGLADSVLGALGLA